MKGGEIGAVVDFFPYVRKKGDKYASDALISRIAANQHGVVLSTSSGPPAFHRRPSIAGSEPPACTAFIAGFIPSASHG
jgi:hypothetical protein